MWNLVLMWYNWCALSFFCFVFVEQLPPINDCMKHKYKYTYTPNELVISGHKLHSYIDHVPNCMSHHKAIVVITGRTKCFHCVCVCVCVGGSVCKLESEIFLQQSTKIFLQKVWGLLHFRSCQNCMSTAYLVEEINLKLLNERDLSTG